MVSAMRLGLPLAIACCLCLVLGTAHADPKQLPAGMSQQQYDELVKSVGESVLQSLQEKGLVRAPPGPAPNAAAASNVDSDMALAESLANAINDIPRVLTGYRDIASDLMQLPMRLDRSAAGGRGPWSFLALLMLLAGVGLLAEAGVQRLTRAARHALAEEFASAGGSWRVGCIAVLDGLALLALWTVVYLGLGFWFPRPGPQSHLASVLLRNLVAWRGYMLLFRVYLRPHQPAIRLVPLASQAAARMFRLFALGVLVVVFAKVWLALLVTPAALDAALLTNSVLVPAVFIYIVLAAHRDIALWLGALINGATDRKEVTQAVAGRWHWLVVPILVLLLVSRAYDALSPNFDLPPGAIFTLNIFVGLLLAETLWAFILRGPRGQTPADPAHGRRITPIVVRTVRAALWVAGAFMLVKAWAVDVLAVLEEREWRAFRHAWIVVLLTTLVAYLAYEALCLATEQRAKDGGRGIDSGAPSTVQRWAAQLPYAASRKQTLAPVLRLVFGLFIVITAALTILETLGINITPLIAGASVFGLAISFGSQHLVHDIVSGFFYLATDAFRVGEYIDCGKAQGTVEGFTLASIRLRHHSGQIHTVPFGQLGHVTNFSRDWSKLKFDLRFQRSTDLEKLRQVTKQVGLAMAADPELQDDFLEPLKMQGLVEADDGAITVRFKTTVHPIRPSYIQREAVRRLMPAFKASGIELAGAPLAIPHSGPPEPADLALPGKVH
jgi:small-conductance mechanosensitive channel